MRIIALDVGSKTIGVAVSDDLQLCAHALKTLARRGTRLDVVQVQELCKRYETIELVVGLPYDCEGKEGHRAARVRVLGDALEAAGLRVRYQDESFTTVQATDVLLEADLSRQRRKQVVDRLAAAMILQAFLDAERAAAAPAPVMGGEAEGAR